MNNVLVISERAHPLYEQLKSLPYSFVEREDLNDNNPNTKTIFECTLLPLEEKKALLSHLKRDGLQIISETSYTNGESLLKADLIQGAISLNFFSPTKKSEFVANSAEVQESILSLFSHLELEGEKVSTPGIGFIFPRVLAQIINEAYFALEEDLASSKDIDTAMKFGVNYPLGPLEWKEKIGTLSIVSLLDELYRETNDKRYLCSTKLREDEGS